MSIDSDLIRGHVDTIILKTLISGDKYGYEIMKEIEQKSKGTYELKQPTLYSCLKRLENQGMISAFWKNSEIGGKRHYYKLTKKGRESYESSMNEWFNSRSIIDSLMGSKPTSLTMADEDDEFDPEAVQPEFIEDDEQEPLDSIKDKEEPVTAQIILDDSSTLTQEDLNLEASEPKDFSNEDLDEEDKAMLVDYYKTDENQIDLFGESAPPNKILGNDEEDISPTEATTADPTTYPKQAHDAETPKAEYISNFEGADLSKYRQNNKDNYFEQIAYGVIDENNTNVTINDEESEDTQFNESQTKQDFSDFKFFTNYPTDDEKETDSADEQAEPAVKESDFSPMPEKLHFGFSDSDDDDEMPLPHQFDGLTDDKGESEYICPPISIFGDESEDDTVDYSSNSPMAETQNVEAYEPGDLKPFNIGTYTEPEYKEKLNQLTAYTKNNYETQPKFSELNKIESPTEAKSIIDLREDFSKDGISVRSYTKPEVALPKDKKYLYVNRIKFATSWIVFCVMAGLLGLTYVLAESLGYTDLNLVSTALPASTYFILAGVVVLVVPIAYTVIFLLNRTKRVRPNYNVWISLVFALLFFIVCLNIIYTLNILNGFTKFSQKDYNHLLWMLPSVDALLIVFQSIVYSILFKTNKFNA